MTTLAEPTTQTTPAELSDVPRTWTWLVVALVIALAVAACVAYSARMVA